MTSQIAALRTQVETLLEDLLGTYRYSNGETTPAIWVDQGEVGVAQADGSVKYPERPKLDQSALGLEVILQPDTGLTFAYLQGGRQLNPTVAIVVKQWDLTKTTVEAVERLVAGLKYRLEVGPRVMRSSALDSLEQCTVTVAIPRFVLT